MTLVVGAKIVADSSDIDRELDKTAAKVANVGKAASGASTDTARLKSETDALAAAEGRAGQAAQKHAAGQDVASAAMARNTKQSGAARAGYQQLGFQVQDVFQQFALGVNPLVILAQQGGQTASALALMGQSAEGSQSKFLRFATFLSGPYGAALFGIVTIGGFLIQSLLKADDATDDLKNSSLSLEAALRREKAGTEAALEALKAFNREKAVGQEQDSLSTQSSIRLAKARIQEALATREALNALVERNLAELDRGPTGPGGQGQQIYIGINRALQDRLSQNKSTIENLKTALNNLRIVDAEDVATAAVDTSAGIKRKYELQIDAAKRAAKGNRELTATLADQLTQIKRNEQAELDLERNRRQALRTAEAAAKKAVQLSAFGRPIDNAPLSSRFGARNSPGGIGSTNHQGVDYRVAAGTPVRATQAGFVDFASNAGGYGNLIKLVHGAGTETRYGHLSRFAVGKGQAVEKGDIIGYSGGERGAPGAGNSTGAHLHYEVRVNGKAVDPQAGRFPFDPLKVQEVADKAAEALQSFGDRASESIQRISERFDDQPRLIDQSAQAVRQLDDVIKELELRKPPGYEEKLKEAEAAQLAARDAPQKAFRDLIASGDRQLQQQTLLLQGRGLEAEALARIQAFQERNVDLTQEQRAAVYAQVVAEDEINRLIEVRGRKLSIYGAAVDDVRGALEDLLSGGKGKDFLGNIQSTFKNLQGRLLTDSIFGPVERDLDDFLNGRTGLNSQIDRLAEDHGKVADASDQLASVMGDAATSIAAASRAIANPDLVRSGAASLPPQRTDPDGAIVVRGSDRPRPSLDPSAEQFFTRVIEGTVGSIASQLDDTFGVTYFSQMQGAFAGALVGYAQAGTVGGILGGAQGLARAFGDNGIIGKSFAETISKTLGQAGEGAVAGYRNAAILDAVGVKSSKTGGAIGGAIGNFIPGLPPGVGSLVGSFLGSIGGGLFKKTKSGSATIGASDGEAAVSGTRGNSKSYRGVADSLGGGVADSINSIVEALDGELGSFAVSIGKRKGRFVVDEIAAAAARNTESPTTASPPTARRRRRRWRPSRMRWPMVPLRAFRTGYAALCRRAAISTRRYRKRSRSRTSRKYWAGSAAR